MFASRARFRRENATLRIAHGLNHYTRRLMLRTLERFRLRLWRYCVATAVVALLAGCASTLSARVTTFQKWPAQAQGQTYRIVPKASQANNLEYQTFADTIRASIGPTGMVEAHGGQAARFDVSFEYSNPAAVALVQSYGDPYFNNGFGPAWGGYYGMRRGWGGGVMIMPSTVTVPVSVYKNTLEVTIRDNQNHGAEVYRSTAVSASGSDDLSAAMPYLARAVFEGFPGNNGQTRDITYERQPR
jgi:hypothetical protein